MAERGGYRRPSKQESFSGVGSRSRRTDKQAVKSPSVQDSTDLQVNDRERIRQGQKVAPLSRVSPPTLAAPPRGGSMGAAGGGAVPQNLLEMPANREGESITEGLPFGPGGGPEVLESFQQPTEKQQLAAFMARRPGASPKWQAVISAQADEMRPPEMAPEPRLSPVEPIEEEVEQPMIEVEDEDLAPEDLPPEELNIPDEAMIE